MILIATCTMCNYHYPLEAVGSPLYRNMSWYDIVPILKISEPNRREEWPTLTCVAKLCTQQAWESNCNNIKGVVQTVRALRIIQYPKWPRNNPQNTELQHRMSEKEKWKAPVGWTARIILLHVRNLHSSQRWLTRRAKAPKALETANHETNGQQQQQQKLVQHRMIRQENAQRQHREGKKKGGKSNRAFKLILNDSLESGPKKGLSSQNIPFDKGWTTVLW